MAGIHHRPRLGLRPQLVPAEQLGEQPSSLVSAGRSSSARAAGLLPPGAARRWGRAGLRWRRRRQAGEAVVEVEVVGDFKRGLRQFPVICWELPERQTGGSAGRFGRTVLALERGRIADAAVLRGSPTNSWTCWPWRFLTNTSTWLKAMSILCSQAGGDLRRDLVGGGLRSPSSRTWKRSARSRKVLALMVRKYSSGSGSLQYPRVFLDRLHHQLARQRQVGLVGQADLDGDPGHGIAQRPVLLPGDEGLVPGR